MAIFKYKDRVITPGRGWSDDEGYKHPGNWNIWSNAEKTAKGITEITEETPPDSRLYRWSRNSDGTINKKPKDLVKLKESLTERVKTTQGSSLSQTDWTIVRKVDTGTEVPVNIQTWRDAIRTRATEMEAAIEGAADLDAIAELFVKRTGNEDGTITKTGILYDWPELEEEE